jgi:hypothetical protein
MQYLKDILLKDLTPDQLKEVDKGVKALIRSSETVTMDQETNYQLSRLNRAEKYLNLPLTKKPATLNKILKRLKEIQQKYNLIV